MYFGASGALGFDTLAAQCVLSLRKRYPHIKLILVLPCTTQTKGWSKDDIAVYEEIKSQADKVTYRIKEHPAFSQERQGVFVCGNELS